MTLEQYENEIYSLESQGKFKELYDLQYKYMNAEYKAFCDRYNTRGTAYIIARDLLFEAINHSITGQACVDAMDYDFGDNSVNDVLEDVYSLIGDCLLDFLTYDDSDGNLIVDCMFGGLYVPQWDGWEED